MEDIKLCFKKENRKINHRHVEELKASILEHGYLSCNPIIANANGEIIDGQHRYVACQELGIDPFIITINDIPDELMVDLNKTQRCWGIPDFINFYAKKGISEYMLLKNFVIETKLAITPALMILTNGKTIKFDKIKSGILEIGFEAESSEYEHCLFIADCINKTARFLRLPHGNKSLTEAIIVLSKIEGFDIEYLIDKLSRYRDELYLCGSTKGYINLFLKLYNLNKKGVKISLGD